MKKHTSIHTVGESLRFPANGLVWTAGNCESDLETLSNIKDVDCTQSSLDSSDTLSATYTIIFNSYPTIPHENNIFFHQGNPPLDDIVCSTAEVTSGTNPTCVVSDVINSNLVGKNEQNITEKLLFLLPEPEDSNKILFDIRSSINRV